MKYEPPNPVRPNPAQRDSVEGPPWWFVSIMTVAAVVMAYALLPSLLAAACR